MSGPCWKGEHLLILQRHTKKKSLEGPDMTSIRSTKRNTHIYFLDVFPSCQKKNSQLARAGFLWFPLRPSLFNASFPVSYTFTTSSSIRATYSADRVDPFALPLVGIHYPLQALGHFNQPDTFQLMLLFRWLHFCQAKVNNKNMQKKTQKERC